MQSRDYTEYYNHNAERVNARRTAHSSMGDLIPFLHELKPNSRVLDWGCGSGIDLLYIEQSGHQGVGLDGSSKMLELARLKSRGFNLIQKNGLFYTPEESEFDGIWINETLNLMPFEQAQRVVASCFRGLKENGLMGIIVREGHGYYEDREDDLEGPSRTLYLYAEKQLCPMIEQTGFQIIKLGRRPDRPGLLLVLARAISKSRVQK